MSNDHFQNLQDENSFLKMKLMLENDAAIGGSAQLSPEVENTFLKSILEAQQSHQTSSVFKIVGKPNHFPSAHTLTDTEIELEWKRLDSYIQHHGVRVNHCSPNVTPRELYTFVTEELFPYETEVIPGRSHYFIYDEFHPDHKYDNSQTALSLFLHPLFSTTRFSCMNSYADGKIRLNHHGQLTAAKLEELVNQFKSQFNNIQLQTGSITHCSLETNTCTVAGTYIATALSPLQSLKLRGTWQLLFTRGDFGFWEIAEIDLPNLDI